MVSTALASEPKVDGGAQGPDPEEHSNNYFEPSSGHGRPEGGKGEALAPLDSQKSGFSEPKFKNLFKMNSQNETFSGGFAP